LRTDIIKLIKLTYLDGERDENGNQIEVESEPKEVFCEFESVTQSEFFSASQQGFKSEFKIITSEFDYEDEQIAVFKTKRYAIYRTFLRKDDKINLYLAQKVGV